MQQQKERNILQLKISTLEIGHVVSSIGDSEPVAEYLEVVSADLETVAVDFAPSADLD